MKTTGNRVRVEQVKSTAHLEENSMKSTNVAWFKGYLASRLSTTRGRTFDKQDFTSKSYTRAELAHICRIVGMANPVFKVATGPSRAPYMQVTLPNGQDLCVWLR